MRRPYLAHVAALDAELATLRELKGGGGAVGATKKEKMCTPREVEGANDTKKGDSILPNVSLGSVVIKPRGLEGQKVIAEMQIDQPLELGSTEPYTFQCKQFELVRDSKDPSNVFSFKCDAIYGDRWSEYYIGTHDMLPGASLEVFDGVVTGHIGFSVYDKFCLVRAGEHGEVTIESAAYPGWYLTFEKLVERMPRSAVHSVFLRRYESGSKQSEPEKFIIAICN